VTEEERYKKIALGQPAVDRMLVKIFLQANREAPQEITLDVDSADDPSRRAGQEGRFFHGYSGARSAGLFAAVHLLRRASAGWAAAPRMFVLSEVVLVSFWIRPV
jgi:hypothetical protein